RRRPARAAQERQPAHRPAHRRARPPRGRAARGDRVERAVPRVPDPADAARGDHREPDDPGEAAREDPVRPDRRGSERVAHGGAVVARAGRADARHDAGDGRAGLVAEPGAAPHPARARRGGALARARRGPDRARSELAAVREREGRVTRRRFGRPLLAALLAAALAAGCAAGRPKTRFFTLGTVAPEAGAAIAPRPELGLA